MHLVSGQVLEQWNTLTDEQVVRRVVTGQTALFELLIRRHEERVYRVVRAIERDDEDAEDVLRQSYLNAYAHLRQFSGQVRFSTWLTRIAINESLARMRERGCHEPCDDGLTAAAGLRHYRPRIERVVARVLSSIGVTYSDERSFARHQSVG
jgi:RNA polymerase sigma factor (sigma-70 family)